MPPQQTPQQSNPSNVYQPQQTSVPPQPVRPPLQPQPLPVQPGVPPRRRSKKRIVVLGILLGLGLLGFGAYMLFGRSSLPQTDMGVVNSVGSSPSAADVAALDKTEAFWAYFKNAAEQQKLVVTKVEAGIPDGQDPAGAKYNYSKAGIDYASKKYVIAGEEHEKDEVDGQYRCYDSKSYIPRGSLDRWLSSEGSDVIYQCEFDKRQDKFNDGVNTGGLTPKQAQEFVGTLRAQAGLVTVQNLQLVQHKDKPYLHFTVQFTPVPGPSGMLKFGGGWLMMAFRKTGIDPVEHPYAFIAAEGGGFTYEYYVDPATKLPAYSEVVLDRNEEKATGTHVYKNHYRFGTDTFDAKTTNHAPITFDW